MPAATATATLPASLSQRANEIFAPDLTPDRSRELWLGWPKGGKTLGVPDADLVRETGFIVSGRRERCDDYSLWDPKSTSGMFDDLNLRVFEMKPMDMLDNIADGFQDAAIVGLDVMKEFNCGQRRQKGRYTPVPVLNLDLAPCALAVAVRSDDSAQNPADLNGRVAVTKYPNALNNWARKSGIRFSRIIQRNGGIESYGAMVKDAVIADMVESGRSLGVNGWRILGMNDTDWRPIAGGFKKFSSLSMDEMAAISGVITPSRTVLVRSSRRLTSEKEKGIELLTLRFLRAATNLGKKPFTLDKRVSQQRNIKPWQIQRALEAPGRGFGHSCWHN